MEQVTTKEKKERQSNFQLNDVLLLIDLVAKNQKKVECKKTDAMSNKEKEKAWDELCLAFNLKSLEVRAAPKLRAKWESLKKSARKEAAELKRSLLKTGGGPPSIRKLSVVTEQVVAIIGTSATGTSANYDCDNTEFGKFFH